MQSCGVQFSTYYVPSTVSLVKQAALRENRLRLLFCFRIGLRDMLKQQFSYFLLEECTRKRD